MRQFMEGLLKEELRILALNTREQLNLTQSKMAEKLVMCDHSYSDIEIGQNMCGTLTAFLLLSTLEDPNAFITKTKEKLEKLSQEKMKSEEGGMQLK
ncbi:MAG: hypothetical protein IJ325_09995 [Clostridia bacterium]|nr:hypothetical protein [Clostridia bacterium]